MIQRSLGLWVGVVALVGCGHGIRHEVVSAGTTAAAPITMPLSTGTYDLKLHIMSPRAQVVQYEWVCQPAGGVAFTRSGSVGQPFAEFRTARLAQLNRERKAQADRLTQQAQYALSQPQPASGQPQPAVVASGQPQPTVVASGQITANVNTPIGSVNAGILLNDRDQQDYIQSLLNDLQQRGLIAEQDGRFTLPGQSAIPFADEPAIQRIRYDLEHVQLPDNLPRTQEKARALAKNAMLQRSQDFAASARSYLFACRLQWDVVESGEPGSSLEDLRWYMASYA
ncbi:MAG: hypothetical protein KBG15_16955, partial [Kofleriaceae bacterium]|nr:hypothetical protein [Kofleriaceae bacterium]